jgi:uncharacterized membrane protein
MPIVRTYISLPAGIAKMPFVKFCIYTFLGSFPWCLLLAYIGTVVGNNLSVLTPIFRSFEVIILIALVILVALYIWRHIRNDRKARAEQAALQQQQMSQQNVWMQQPQWGQQQWEQTQVGRGIRLSAIVCVKCCETIAIIQDTYRSARSISPSHRQVFCYGP